MKKFFDKWVIKFIIALIAAMFIAIVVYADDKTYTRNGNTFEQVSTRNTASSAVKTPYKYKDSKGKEYDIYITKNGRCLIHKVSSKTGKEYNYYLSKELSKTICKELNVEYIETKKDETK